MPDNDTQNASTSAPENTMEEALNNGQLDPDPDSGPTPGSEGDGDGTAGRHTPDSDPSASDESDPSAESEEVDVSGDVDAESDQTPEEQAEEQLEEEEEASDEAASDQEQDSEDGGEDEDESGDFFYEGEYSDYRSKEEALNAIDKKDEIIYRYSDELKEERKRREQAEAQVQRLQETMPEDQQKEMMVQRFMRDELGDDADELLSKSEEELASNQEQQKRVMKARARAEARYEDRLEKAEEQQEQQIEQRRERLDEASEFVQEYVTPETFDAQSTEDRIRLSEHFQEVPDGAEYNRAEKAVLLHADYGRDVAKHYLEGIRQEFLGDRQQAVEKTVEESEAEPKPQPKPSTDGPDSTSRNKRESYESDNPLQTLVDAQEA